MFPEKERNWISGSEYAVSFTSWKEWMNHRTDKTFGWADYKFIHWNISKDDDGYKMQVLFLRKYGSISINEIRIRIKPEDEDSIRKWASTAFEP